ncbi:elongation of very long chain fatty acids protein-like [Aricia agestis]|uniref:elongation of very long chain fatty acids protein-like n=1 Tax=Aricia agestis TaxID=91739 RepID=UPI001C20391D|nr:elongation of very long chain fatty acids protein-like [Aricia agestis]
MATDVGWFKYIFEDLACPLTVSLPFAGNPIPFLILIGAYLLFCLKIGPWFMKNKRPYNLKKTIQVYNFLQVILSAFLVVAGSRRLFLMDYDFTCEDFKLDSESTDFDILLSYTYFYAKLTELLDTVFFVLRKSFRQISFLHLFHHTFMPCICWFGITYYPAGNASVFGTANSLVHVVMYTYYLLASFGDKYKKYLWWKKYVTVMQLAQFVLVGLHSFHSMFYTHCNYPILIKLLIVVQAIVFFNMFWSFYSSTYLKKGKSAQNGSRKAH